MALIIGVSSVPPRRPGCMGFHGSRTLKWLGRRRRSKFLLRLGTSRSTCDTEEEEFKQKWIRLHTIGGTDKIRRYITYGAAPKNGAHSTHVTIHACVAACKRGLKRPQPYTLTERMFGKIWSDIAPVRHCIIMINY